MRNSVSEILNEENLMERKNLDRMHLKAFPE